MYNKFKEIKKSITDLLQKKKENKLVFFRAIEIRNFLASQANFKRLFKWTMILNFAYFGYYLILHNEEQYNWSFTRGVSRRVGYLAQMKIPETLRNPIFNYYCKVYNVNKEEILDQNFKNYKSINEFFIRKIKVIL
jgi:hypothetical protein